MLLSLFYYSHNFQNCLQAGQGEDKDKEKGDVNLDRDQAGVKTPGKVVSWPILPALKKLCTDALRPVHSVFPKLGVRLSLGL